MKVKCKICGLKGFFDESKVTEFHATRFLFIGKFLKNKLKSYVVCRNCIRDILDSLQSEQYRINGLYEPEVKEKSDKKPGIQKKVNDEKAKIVDDYLEQEK